MTVDRETEFLFDGPVDAPLTVALAHGAGAPMDSPFMAAVAAGLGARGWRVARFEFPYMRARRETGAGRGMPDPPERLRAAWRRAVVALGGGDRVVVGGKSLGGRIASTIADEVGARGLVCMGYPFHPPGRPDQLRTAHLRDLQTPTLIVQGTRDAFGTPAEIAGYDLSPAIRLAWIESGDHSWKPRRDAGRTAAEAMLAGLGAIDIFLAARVA